MQKDAAVYTVGDFVRRVVESLFRADFRGPEPALFAPPHRADEGQPRQELYAKRDIIQVIDELFRHPGFHPAGVDGAVRQAAAPGRRRRAIGMRAEGH